MAHATGAGTDIHVEPKQVLETIGRHMLVDGFPIVVDLEKSEGIRLRDKADGRTYLDFFQFFASLPIGINHPKLTDPAFREKLGAVAVNKPSDQMGCGTVARASSAGLDVRSRRDASRDLPAVAPLIFDHAPPITVRRLHRLLDDTYARAYRAPIRGVNVAHVHVEERRHGRSKSGLAVRKSAPRRAQ